MSERRSGTVTFLFTDIEGSTALLKRLGRERYGELLAEQQRLLREAFASHKGEVVDTQGDSFFVAFRSASDALIAAVAIQRSLGDHEWPDGADVRVRVGIHTGEADAAGERYVGFSVHRAARIGGVAHGGQVLLSSSTRELVEDDLPPHVFLRDLGLFRLKDVERPERISQVAAEGLPAEFPPLRGAERVKTPMLRRRSMLAAAVVGVVAAAVAIPVFALSSGGSGDSQTFATPGANAVDSVDARSGRPTGSVTLAGSPKAVAYGEGSVWVTMPSQNAVARVNAETDAVQQTIGVGSGPAGVASGDGFVWVANSLDGTISQIDPRTNGGQVVGKVDVGNGPTGVAYGLGGVWVANAVDRTVVRIDPLTSRPGKPIPVSTGADAIAVGDGAIWVTSRSAAVLSRIDPKSRNMMPINVGNDPRAVAAGRGAVWVANGGDATVSRVDPATNHVTATIQVDDGPSGVAVSPDGTSVWVSSELAGTLSKIDAVTGTVIKRVTVGDLPQAVAVSTHSTYVAAQGSRAHRGGTLTLLVSNPSGVYDPGLPQSLDPAYGYTAWELATLTNDGLVGYSRTGGGESYRVVPDLALSLPTISDGGRTYTFQLRPGVHYSTGAQVQPADFRRAIERALLTGGDFTTSFHYTGIVGAKACTGAKTCDLSKGIVTSPSSDTVAFHLTTPDPDFVNKLALPTAAAVPADTPVEAKLPLPATGPYMVAEIDEKRSVVRLVRNPRFHAWSLAAQPAGYPDEIVERWGYTGESAVRAVEHAKADITSTGYDKTWPPALMSTLRTRYSSLVYTTPQAGTLGVWMNTKVAPFNDVRVRQAVNYAVDRNRIVEINGGPGNAQIGCQILTPNMDGYRPYCPYTKSPDAAGTYNGPDLAKARRLVAASGTKGQPITVWFYDIPIGRANGGYITSVLRSLGYKPRLNLLPHDGRSTFRPNRQIGVGGWSSDFASPNDMFSGYFSCFSSPNANLARLCDPRVDREIARARALQLSDPSAASRIWTKIDQEVTNDAPWVTMHTSVLPDFVSRRTGNYTYCFLTSVSGSAGACLDQLWVR